MPRTTSPLDMSGQSILGLATAAAGTNTQQAANTAFVTAAVTAASIPGGAAGTDRQLQFNSAGVLAGAARATVTTEGHLNLAEVNADVAIPASGGTLFMRNRGERRMVGYMDAQGNDYILQPMLASNKVSYWTHSGNSAAIVPPQLASVGVVLLVTGTATARNVATTNVFQAVRRLGTVSAATAGGSTSIQSAVPQFFRSITANMGGFTAVFRFGASDAAAVAQARSFVGMHTSTATIGNVNPSTLLNILGVGHDSAETTLSIMHNDGTGTATKVALGASFPANSLSTDFYEFRVFAAKGSAVTGWFIENLSTGVTAQGVITTKLPAVNTLLCPHLWRNNGATALAVGLDVSSVYIETDN